MLNLPSEKTVSCCLWSAQAQRLSDLANPGSHLHCVVFFPMAGPRETLLTFPMGVMYPLLLCPFHSFSAETCLKVLKEWDRIERNRRCCKQKMLLTM